MEFNQFLNRIINDGIEAATKHYSKSSQKDKKEGSIAGFEACRNKDILELKDLLEKAKEQTHLSRISINDNNEVVNYWFIRCFELEVEWVCNCVSACLYNEKKPVIITPTVRGMMKAAEIVGIAEYV